MLKHIQTWLANPKRSYAEGLAIFEAAASADIKKKYLEYFQKNKNASGQFHPAYCLLINKVVQIEYKMNLNPDAFRDIKLIVTGEPQATAEELKAKQDEID